MQSRGQGVRRGTNSQFPDSTKTLKAHDLVLGSILFLTKQAPSGRFRANIFMNYNLTSGKIIINDRLKKTVDKLDHLLLGRATPNKHIIEDIAVTDID